MSVDDKEESFTTPMTRKGCIGSHLGRITSCNPCLISPPHCRAGRSNLVLVWPSCQPYLESRAHKLLGGSGGMPPRKVLKIRCPNMLFRHIFTLSIKDILYITLKVQAAQNVSTQNDLKMKTKKFFFTINGPAIAGATGLLPLALHCDRTFNTLIKALRNTCPHTSCNITQYNPSA